MIEEIKVQNGLRQGCCMAPVLFNLYTCLAIERRLEKVRGDKGVGMTIHYNDDGAILASTRPGAEKAALVYQQTTRDFGGGGPGPNCTGGR